ncbi:MAG: lactate utilization protein [Frankiales bacterium]|nr:lactate utilization protein [Frankiales bacterium]
MTAARDEVLARVRAALSDAPADAPIVRNYRQGGTLDRGALTELLSDRLRDYKATVRLATVQSLPAVIAEAFARRGARSIAVPDGLDPSWLDALAGLAIRADSPDAPLTAAQLDGIDGTVTASAVAIAETGTIVLDGSPGHGRRVLSLVPDYHLCVVHADAIVQTVPEALRRLDATRPQTWISGPSATSDIELQRVEGVHGPRTLEVVIVG